MSEEKKFGEIELCSRNVWIIPRRVRLIIDEQPDGSLLARLPDDTPAWLKEEIHRRWREAPPPPEPESKQES